MSVPNVERARAVYSGIRDCWVAGGGGLEAHDRLAVITVAAALREFALLTHTNSEEQSNVAARLNAIGMGAAICSSEFDLAVEADEVSPATTEAYLARERQRSPLTGVGVWARPDQVTGCVGMDSLGAALLYPSCCESMDLRTKYKDHELQLSAIVEQEGDDAERVAKVMREHHEYEKASYDHCIEWSDRFYQTLAKFPFVIHTACDQCLRADDSPSAILNRQYEDLAAAVSEELHLMLRWGAIALVRSQKR